MPDGPGFDSDKALVLARRSGPTDADAAGTKRRCAHHPQRLHGYV